MATLTRRAQSTAAPAATAAPPRTGGRAGGKGKVSSPSGSRDLTWSLRGKGLEGFGHHISCLRAMPAELGWSCWCPEVGREGDRYL